VRIAHRQHWNLSPKEAVAEQKLLARNVNQSLPFSLPKNPIIAGGDISYNKGSDKLFVAIVLLQMPSLEVIEMVTSIERAKFPYVPGLLSYREAPALLTAFRKLRQEPDIVLIDGHGLAHPRRFGIASHLGWILDIPTIGCGKSILCGSYGKLKLQRGAQVQLKHKGEIIGCALRTRASVQPVYVSVGNRVDLSTAVDIVLMCSPKFRIPEPIRKAHGAVNKLRVESSL